jgi:Reverse transcriptase (RNA-dependent DNA polymerase)
VFGNGTSALSDTIVRFGAFDAHMLSDEHLEEDLISTNPFLDSGYILSMSKDGGTLVHPETGETVKVYKEGPRWMVDLEDVAKLRVGPCKARLEAVLNGECLTSYARAVSISLSQRQRVIDLHNRMGHAAQEVMCKAVDPSEGAWSHSDLTPSQIRRVMKQEPCLVCWLAKRNKSPIPEASGDRRDTVLPGEILSSDIIGKINPPTRDGHCWFFLFADVATGYMHVYTAKSKDGYLSAIKSVIKWYRSKNLNPKIMRTDSERMLIMGDVGRYLEIEGITPEHSAPDAHYQNFVERYVQTVVKGTSAMLHGQRFLKANQWDKALYHLVDCKNHSPNSKCGNMSPSMTITGERTNVKKKFQYSFGDLVSVGLAQRERDWKFDLRHDIAIYVGQSDHSVDSGLVYYPYTGQYFNRSNLKLVDLSEDAYHRFYSRRHDLKDTSATPWRDLSTAAGDIELDFESQIGVSGEERFTLRSPLADPDEIPTEISPAERKRRMIEPSDRILRPRVLAKRVGIGDSTSEGARLDCNDDVVDSYEEDFINHLVVKALAASMTKLTVTQVMKSAEADDWVIAIKKEIDALLGTTLVPEEIDKSQPFQSIHGTMQLKRKMQDATTLDKLKARLCACGNELAGLIAETYSPTVSSLAHSVLHQIAVTDGMETCLMDTVAAYLNQDYPQDAIPLYLTLPKNVAEICGLDPNVTYRVKRYIYGLPDAGRAYYLAYKEHLMQHGYFPTASDPCLFVRFEGDIRTYVWFHVDDTFVASTHKEELTRLQDKMKLRFEITVNYEVDNHLGIKMEKLADGSVRLTQPKLLKQIFDEYPPDEIHQSKGVPVPLRASSSDTTNDEAQETRSDYLHLLGMLNYLTRSRPDLCTALSFAATNSHNPTESNFEKLLHVVRYLWDTQDRCLIIRPSKSNVLTNNPLRLTCYVDASYLTHSDSKSHTGYCMSFGTIGTFYAKSSKQHLVATSSTHAEVRALYTLVLDVIFVINLCDEIRRPIELPAIIFEDNQPAIDLSESLNSRIKKCKHFLMLVNFIREQVTDKLIDLRKIPTEDNIADLLTKPLLGPSFESKAKYLLGIIE